MGRHNSLEEEPAKIMEMENAIKKFQSSLKSKQPLTKKSITFQNWRKSIPVPATFDDWILFLNFLVGFLADTEWTGSLPTGTCKYERSRYLPK